MIYENYEKKMLRVAKVRDTLRKHRLKIIIGACILFAAIAVLLFLNGMIVKDISGLPERITYGETLSFESGGAIFGSTYCEYSEAGSDEWTTEQPEMPGEYAVRLVSVRTFGIKSYGETHTFTIDRFKAELTIPSVSVVYGEDPELSVGLVGGDRVEAVDFSYAGLTAASPLARSGVAGSVEVTAGADSVTVVNSEGEDVSAAYEFTPVTVTLDVLPRDITITSDSAEKVYDGTPLTCESSTVTDGSLAEGDSYAVASYNAAITNVAESGAPNTISVSDITFSGSWGDVTPFYNVTAESGTLSVTKRPLSLETSGGEKMYDGGALTAESYTVTSGTLAGGQNIIATDWTALTRAGSAENAADIRILAGEEDVTANYDISVTCGTLTVTPRPVTITTDSPTKVYDGLAAQPYGSTEHGFTIGGEGIVEGEDYGMTWTGSATLVSDTGKENAGTFAISSDGEDITYCYDITYVFGTFTITKRPITLTSADAEKVYDGTPLTNEAYEITSGGLAVTDGISATFTGAITYVAESHDELNTFSVTFTHSSLGDVTDCYDIEYIFGSMTVTPRPLSVVMENADKVYDGTPLTSDEYRLDTETGGMELVDGETLIVDGNGSITNVGEEENDVNEWYVSAADGADRSGNYTLSSASGTLTVTPRPITIKAADAEREYNGCAIDAHGSYEVLGVYGLVSGQNITQITTLHDKYIKAGTYENAHTVEEGSVIISASDGSEVTANYDISYSSGTLTITKRAITITSGSDSKMYDGQPLKCEKYDITSGSRAETDTITATFTESVTFVSDGTVDNKFTVVMTHSDPNVGEVTDSYDISYVYGTLKITSRPITITSEGETKPYDGTPLKGSRYTLTGDLAENDDLTVTFGSGIIHARESGAFKNTFSVKITHPSGVDATSSYDISRIFGRLDVTRISLGIVITGGEKTYDGKPFEFTVEFVGLAETDSGYAVMPECIDAGEYTVSYVSYLITHSNGSDSTGDYDPVDCTPGNATILKRCVSITMTDAKKEYDGTPLTSDAFEIADDTTLAEGDMLTVDGSGNITDVLRDEVTGEVIGVPNGVDVDGSGTWCVTAPDGRDVTHNYTLSVTEGTLTITPRELTITAVSLSKEYDRTTFGESEYKDKYEKEGLRLVEGHCIEGFTTSVSGDMPVYPGETAEHIADVSRVVILDEFGYDKTFNYDITGEGGTLSVTKRVIVYTTETKSWEYDGLPHSAPDIVVKGGTFLDGDVAEALQATQITEVGSLDNVVTYTVTGEDGSDVSAYYDLVLSDEGYGTLTITPKVIKLESGSAEKEYDGTPLTCYLVYGTEALSDGDTLHVTGGTSITDPGEITNELTVVITDADGNDVTSRYSIVWLYGALRVYANGGSGGGSPSGIDTSGSLAGGEMTPGNNDGDIVMLMIRSSVGGTVYLRLMSYGDYIYSGWDKAYEYTGSDLSPLYYATESLIAGGAETATLDVINYANDYVLPYYIASYSSQKGDVTITSSDTGGYSVGYIPGDYLTESGAFSRISISGMSAYESYVLSEYLTVPEDTKTQLLSLASEAGISADDPDVINKVAEYIRNAATYDLEYDSAMDEKDDVVVSFLTEYKRGVCRHFASAAALMYRALGIPARYTIGYAASAASGEWSPVTAKNAHAWTEVYISGVGWVAVDATGVPDHTEEPDTEEKITLRVVTDSAEKVYDGEPLTCLNYTLLDDGALLAGHKLSADEGNRRTSSRTDAGTVYNSIGFTVSDSGGADVTDMYEIKIVEYGTLTVTPRPITLKVADKSKPYDGYPLTSNEVVVAEDSAYRLVSDHAISATCGGSITDPGTADNDVVELKILDGSGNDMTANYDVTVLPGSLTVTAAPVVSLSSYAFTYDGTPHTVQPDDILWVKGGSTDVKYTVSNVELHMTDESGATVAADRLINAGVYDIVIDSFELYENGKLAATYSDGEISYTGDASAETGHVTVDTDSGTIIISPAMLYIISDSAERPYMEDENGDPVPLTAPGWSVWMGSLAEGDRIIESTVKVTGEQTNKGLSGNSFEDKENIRIEDADGNDVTSNYTIVLLEGILTVT